MDTSTALYAARMMGVSEWMTPALLRAARADVRTPFSPLYALWAMENCAKEGKPADALSIARMWEKHWPDYRLRGAPLLPVVLKTAAAMHHQIGDPQAEAAAWRHLIRAEEKLDGDTAQGWYGLGELAQRNKRWSEAREYFRKAAASPGAPEIRAIARRNAHRLATSMRWVREDPVELAIELLGALRRKDDLALVGLASESHFTLGQVGSESHYTDAEILLPKFLADLRCSAIWGNPLSLTGQGAKRYLLTEGWSGDVFRGRTWLRLSRAPGGWEWSGLGTEARLPATQALFRQVIGESLPLSNHPLEVEIKAPWAAPLSMQAGGFSWFMSLVLGGVIGGQPIGDLVRIAIGDRDCGFGPGGFYYNVTNSGAEGHRFSTGPDNNTWTDDQYAIDFSRWERASANPLNLARNTPVVACAQGVILRAVGDRPAGDDAHANKVWHRIIGSWSEDTPYTALYVHLDGPNRLTVSAGMWVNQGFVLGLIDDTGNSFHDHLHFEMHDVRLREGTTSIRGGDRASPYGHSIRPTPMDGQTLNDGDDGRCIKSSNRIANPLSYCRLLARISGQPMAAALCTFLYRDEAVVPRSDITITFDARTDDRSVSIDAEAFCTWVALRVPPESRAEALRICREMVARRSASPHIYPVPSASSIPDPRLRPKAYCLWQADQESNPILRREFVRFCNSMPDDRT